MAKRGRKALPPGEKMEFRKAIRFSDEMADVVAEIAVEEGGGSFSRAVRVLVGEALAARENNGRRGSWPRSYKGKGRPGRMVPPAQKNSHGRFVDEAV